MNRGDQREDSLRDDEDRQKFLTTLAEACGNTEWQAGQEMERWGWDEDQLRARPKGHRSKVLLAQVTFVRPSGRIGSIVPSRGNSRIQTG
ncbi:MAG: hypothetical protein NT154_09340 [Verrucomicrobia bacterium]|nr:hypothetical protein [Verrucomicrobiota bacterium]